MIFRAALLGVAATLVLPGVAAAAVKAGQLLPTNLLTVPDSTQATGLRVNLPKPDCAARPSDCADIDVLNDARRLQHPAAHLHPVQRCDRPVDGLEAGRSSSSARANTSSGRTRSSGSPQRTRCTSRATSSSTSRRRTCSSSRAAFTAPTASRSTPRASVMTSTTDRRRIPRSRRTARRCSTRCRWQGPSACEPERHRRCEPLHDADDHGDLGEDPRPAPGRRRRTSCSGPAGERTVFPFSSVASVTWQRQVRTAPPDQFTTGGLFLPLLIRRRHDRVRLVLVAGLRDRRQGHPGRRHRDRNAGPTGHEHRPVHALRAGGRSTRGRLARRDLRPRLHRLEERRAVGRRRNARSERHRLDRDQRRRPWRRPARHVHRQPHRRPAAGDAPARRPRDRPER